MKHLNAQQKPDIHRLLDLQKLLLQFQNIERVVHIPPSLRPETDTEHSYNLAMTAWYLSTFFTELDPLTLFRFALAHDLVEIYAGDTPVHADKSLHATKQAREAAAIKRLGDEWADFPDMLAAIHAYEEKDSPEAKFIYALDKIMPLFELIYNEGYSWKKIGMTLAETHEAKRQKVKQHSAIDDYYQQIYKILSDRPGYFPSPSLQR